MTPKANDAKLMTTNDAEGKWREANDY